MAATADYVSINDAGTTRDNKNSDGATGTNAVAIGVNATSSGLNSQAFGTNAASSGSSSISVGTNSSATGDAASAYGQDAHASANGATAIGRQSVASGSGSIAMGSAAQASAQDATALGPTSNASGNASISIGTQSSATEGQSVAIGRGASATEDSSVALGSYSTTSAAVGTTSATVNGVTYSGFAGTAPASTVSVGSSGAERTVTNVAAGRITADSTDAINGSQLYQVADQVGTNTTNIANNTTAINNINTQVNNYGDQINNINNRIDDMDKDLRAGIAGATAIAFLQRPNEAGKSMVSMAVGGYRGEQALAVGYARNSDNNKWSTKAGVGIDTQKHVNWGGSVGYQW
ncbi:MAG: YadA-like family protein [Neisseria sp.]|nr:YadA-like family protein [Neisseria sp.]